MLIKDRGRWLKGNLEAVKEIGYEFEYVLYIEDRLVAEFNFLNGSTVVWLLG